MFQKPPQSVKIDDECSPLPHRFEVLLFVILLGYLFFFITVTASVQLLTSFALRFCLHVGVVFVLDTFRILEKIHVCLWPIKGFIKIFIS